MPPERSAAVLAAGGDVRVRCGWRNAAGLDATGERFDMTLALRKNAQRSLIDRPIWLPRRGEAPPPALPWSPSRRRRQAAAAARRTARREAPRGGASNDTYASRPEDANIDKCYR